MAHLVELAQRYKKILDGLSCTASTTAEYSAGWLLYKAMTAALGDPYHKWKALEPIVLKTKLAASIVAYLERVPRVALIPQLLWEAEGAHPTAVAIAITVLGIILHCATEAAHDSNNSSVPAIMLRQVHNFP